jgi:hypothetical protein
MGGVTVAMSPMSVAFADSTQRFIAERHKLEVVAPESELQKSWESLVAFCGTIRCEVLTSSITTRTNGVEPSGETSFRVVPEDLAKLLAQVEKLGKIAQHTTDREDKTAAVVDSEASLKNLTTFRDGLRAMLAKPSATVKDLIEIQEKLSETQRELDSAAGQRKILANETEKIAVEVSFRVERTGGNGSGFSAIRDALHESGSNLAESTATLITVIVAVIPWLLIVVPGVWVLIRARRKWRRNRVVVQSPANNVVK